MELTNDVLRKLQLNGLELLVEFDRICRKYKIDYALSGGSLLGAIRHKGFIPWDDDIDVAMTREQYNRFFEAAEKELDKDNYFLQEYRTDKYYRWGWPKLRLLGTDYVRTGQERLKYKRGVFMDILIRDNVPDGRLRRLIHKFECFAIRKILYSELGKTNERNCLLRLWYKILFLIPRKCIFSCLNYVANHENKHRTELNRTLTIPCIEKGIKFGIPSSLHDEYVDVEFEGMLFKTYKNYVTYLEMAYGDYMQLPPEEKRHGNAPCTKLELRDVTLESIQEKYRKFALER